jgi:hypothetical protein
MPKPLPSLIGQSYAFLTVIEEAHRSVAPSGRKERRWRCQCECGTVVTVSQNNLRNGCHKSCGCKRRTLIAKAKTKHGKHGTPEYRIWKGMIQRCEHPAHYKNYGSRGIRVCDRWRHSFASFLSDMGERPTPKHQIDRVDNDGMYEPTNCRWATPTENGRNTRHNHLITINGETKCVSEWSEFLGIPTWTVVKRFCIKSKPKTADEIYRTRKRPTPSQPAVSSDDASHPCPS